MARIYPGGYIKAMKKQITPVAIQALKDALTLAYWYKRDLRSFLYQCLPCLAVLSSLNWSDYKRNIVATLVDHLARREDVYQHELIRLMSEVCRITDFSHLRRLEDGANKAKDAKAAVGVLRAQLTGHQSIQEEAEAAEKRRNEAHARMMRVNAVREKLEKIKEKYIQLVASDDPQRRGFLLEKILRACFELFDLDPKASFRITGEQIDGAFSFEGTDYLLEAKWQQEPVPAKELDSLAGKLNRKLENTLGLFLSIGGFSEGAVSTISSGRRLVILMDGSDLMAVFEGRIDLIELLLRKRRHAAQTGGIYLRIQEVL